MSPPKVKDLIWRAASNCLPRKTQLMSRHVNIDSLCPSCQSARETISHCLVECSFARSCWDRTGIGVDTTAFADWLDDKFKLFEGDNRKIVVITCWATWKVQNELVWKKKGSSVAAVGILAHNSLSQWSQAQDKNDVPTAAFLSTRDGSEKWIKPVGDVVKINVDAALFAETGRFSFACVARDAKSVFLEAISCCRTGCVTPEMAEAMGVREALSWVKRKLWHIAVAETDSLTVVQSIRSPFSLQSYFGSVITDCKSMLQDLPWISVLFIRRSANSVAHFLARASYFCADHVFLGGKISLLNCLM